MTLIGQSSDDFLIAMVSDGTRRNDSIACTLHDTTSIFATYPEIAAVTIA